MHGLETTVPVTLRNDDPGGRAVFTRFRSARWSLGRHALRPEASKEQAFHSAVRILKERNAAPSSSRAARMAETIAFLSERGVPVMGHIGLTPQSINTLGSFRAQGRDEGSWPIENDARSHCGSRRLLSRGRGGRRTAREEDHRGASPFLPSASVPARPAMARCWCWRTCSRLSPRAPKFCVRRAAVSAPLSKPPSRVTPQACVPAHFRGPSTSVV